MPSEESWGEGGTALRKEMEWAGEEMEWLRKEKELKMKEMEKSRIDLEGPFGPATDEEKEDGIASKEAK